MRDAILSLIRRATGTAGLAHRVAELEAGLLAMTQAQAAEAEATREAVRALGRDLAMLTADAAARAPAIAPPGPVPASEAQLAAVNHNLTLYLREAARVRELAYRDLLLALDPLVHMLPRAPMVFEAEKPVAIDTDDHVFPWGSGQDNTRSPRFVAACERHFPGRRLHYMDLGCSGGGLVLDFLLRGHAAWGVEGSDGPMRAQRAEWRILGQSLFTADITRPFSLRPSPETPNVACEVISAWEVMEHIADEDLPRLFANIHAHLAPDGLFIGSISMVPDDDPVTGARYHRTVQGRAWWEARFAELGLPMLASHGFAFEDFCRGTGNGPMDPSYRDMPGNGFHFVARRG